MQIGDKVLYIHNVTFQDKSNLIGATGIITNSDRLYYECKWTPRNPEKYKFSWWVPKGWVRLLKEEELS